MMSDYIPLLYGRAFEPAVPVARVLVALLFTETAFNLGNIILSIDERYRPVLCAQGLLVLAAPLFLWTARHLGLIRRCRRARLGAFRLGAGRLLRRASTSTVCASHGSSACAWRRSRP